MPNTTRSLIPTDLSGVTAAELLDLSEAHQVRFLRLQFTDILGIIKNVELPASQFRKALKGDIMFDGSSIEGFVRVEESDMLLAPDLTTFQIFPWGDPSARVARLICDVNMPDGSAFAGDPRTVLKKQLAKAAAAGFSMNAGMEAEFFLFKPSADGRPSTETHDVGGYFDLAPVDQGEEARRAIVDVLEQMGYEVEAAHHEVAHGQHEIDFRYADALRTADNISTFRFVVKQVARRFGLAGVVHAQTSLRPERKRHAHASIAVSFGAERLLGSKGGMGAFEGSASLHWRFASARAGHVCGNESAREFIQETRARLRGARKCCMEHAQSFAYDPCAGTAWCRHAG